MDEKTAIRLDGMLINTRACLDGIAHYMQSNVSKDEFSSLITLIGAAMAETVEFSCRLHTEFPGIVPQELT